MELSTRPYCRPRGRVSFRESGAICRVNSIYTSYRGYRGFKGMYLDILVGSDFSLSGSAGSFLTSKAVFVVYK